MEISENIRIQSNYLWKNKLKTHEKNNNNSHIDNFTSVFLQS